MVIDQTKIQNWSDQYLKVHKENTYIIDAINYSMMPLEFHNDSNDKWTIEMMRSIPRKPAYKHL